MISAKVYNCNVEPEFVQAAEQGVDLVSRYVGGIAQTTIEVDSVMELVDHDAYKWSVEGVGYYDLNPAALDPAIDLHVVLSDRRIPSEDYDEVHGVAGYLSGVGLMTATKRVIQKPSDLKLTAAHETAHELGFAVYDYETISERDIKKEDIDVVHCPDQKCILNSWSYAKSFCVCCQQNMSERADLHLGLLRKSRSKDGVSLDSMTSSRFAKEYRRQGLTTQPVAS